MKSAQDNSGVSVFGLLAFYVGVTLAAFVSLGVAVIALLAFSSWLLA